MVVIYQVDILYYKGFDMKDKWKKQEEPMSINLHIKTIEGVELNIYQTPTKVTDAIMVDSKGMVEELTGEDAKRAFWAYYYWSTNVNGSYNSKEELEDAIAYSNEHREYLDQFKDKELIVYSM